MRQLRQLLLWASLGLLHLTPVKRALRRWTREAAEAALRTRARPLAPEKLGSVLIIAPHQDDETLGCGGLIVRLVALGRPVQVAFVSDGSASHPGQATRAGAVLIRRREAEAELALARLGVAAGSVHFLRAPDGRLDRLAPSERELLLGRLTALLQVLAPDSIFVTARRDGSTEHAAAHSHLTEALRRSGRRSDLWEYPVWSWWNPLWLLPALAGTTPVRYLRLDRSEHRRKGEALAAYASQLQPGAMGESPPLSGEFVQSFLLHPEYFFATRVAPPQAGR